MNEQDKLNQTTHELCEATSRFLVEVLNGLSPAGRAGVVKDCAEGFRLVAHVQATPLPFTVRVSLLKFGEKPETGELKPIFTCIVPESQAPPFNLN